MAIAIAAERETEGTSGIREHYRAQLLNVITAPLRHSLIINFFIQANVKYSKKDLLNFYHLVLANGNAEPQE